VPTILTWDGRTEKGTFAPEGVYVARLTVSYGKEGTFTVESQSYVLDISAPSASLTFTPAQFSPASSGTMPPVTMTIKASSIVARMDSWSVSILDKNGREFQSFDGRWPNNEIVWDGKSNAGDSVGPAQSYTAETTVRDEFGNATLVSTVIAVNDVPASSRALQPKELQSGLAAGTYTITPGSGGFSPNGDNVMDTMSLSLAYGPHDAVKSWTVQILDANGETRKTFSGNNATLPWFVSWDGKTEAGTVAPDGTYTARLALTYNNAMRPGSMTSSPFVLDTTPPTGTISLSEALFSPMEGNSAITVNVTASSRAAKIDSWRMEIYDPENHLFRTYYTRWPAKSATWDGKGFNGDLVQSAEDYPIVVKVRDEFGVTGVLTSVIPVDILVEKIPSGYRILSSRIFFKPYTADYKDVRPELAAQNEKRLADMTAKLKKFPAYKIRLVGHAVMVHWDDAALGAAEQRDVLLPLSKARAEAVKRAVVDRGLSSAMVTTEGVGASDQLVPDSNLTDHWRNRRVAFYLEM
jgi:outer membrane protein OmpA-like peptidoglycan-associated protein